MQHLDPQQYQPSNQTTEPGWMKDTFQGKKKRKGKGGRYRSIVILSSYPHGHLYTLWKLSFWNKIFRAFDVCSTALNKPIDF